jgi:hypothetical protein
MSLELFIPGERLKYAADETKSSGMGNLFPWDSEEAKRKTLFLGKSPKEGWKREIGRAPFQEVGYNHRNPSGPIAT